MNLEAYLSGLTITQGRRAGEPFSVLPWQSRFVRGAFRAPGPAALTVGRGNGKSALVAAVAAAVVDPDGPLHGNRREAVAIASSFEQSRIVFEDVLGFLRARHDLMGSYKIQSRLPVSSAGESGMSASVGRFDDQRLREALSSLLEREASHPFEVVATLENQVVGLQAVGRQSDQWRAGS